ncbi:hypothetical protein [Streptomyces sp. NPDC007088]|uniref:hypothetical protein n=1 Tax=Streptomyces sp. NPDC007088 TaxID=3364773 RepID=UPI0036C17D94
MDAITESLPAIFAGAVFLLFGGGLLLWTCVRLAHRAPVAEGAHPLASATLGLLTGAGTVLLALWCFSRV